MSEYMFGVERPEHFGPEDEWEVAAPRCACTCGCDADATQKDEGVHLCDECADYYVTEDGDVVCSREQGEDSCRHCHAEITWGRIQTGSPGVSNWREGRCECREWRQTEHGGSWDLSEGEVFDEDEESESNYIELCNGTYPPGGTHAGSGYDVEVLRLDGDEALVCWTDLAHRRSGIAEIKLGDRSIEEVALDAFDGPLVEWGIVWDDDDADAYEALAERWDAAREVRS